MKAFMLVYNEPMSTIGYDEEELCDEDLPSQEVLCYINSLPAISLNKEGIEEHKESLEQQYPTIQYQILEVDL